MPSLRGEEQVALATIASTLNVQVSPHDDGSRPSMYDLKFTTAAGVEAAVEVTAAAESASIQLWKLMNEPRGRWIEPSLHGGWLVTVQPTARGRRLQRELPDLLRDLEAASVGEVRHLEWSFRDQSELERRAWGLGIVSAFQGGTSYPGSIYLTIEQPREGSGSIVDTTGDRVSRWVSEFLADAHQADVLAKLIASGAKERHAFILVPAFSTAPSAVTEMLWHDMRGPTPTGQMQVPPEVSHVWLMTFWTVGSGLRWSSADGWQRFERNFAVSE